MDQHAHPDMPPLLAGFVQHLERIRSPRTAQAYGEVAAAFLEHLGKKRDPERVDVETFLVRPQQNGSVYAPTTRNHRLGALRALSKYAVAESRWPSDPTVGISFVREPPRDPAVLSTHEVALFFRALERVSPPKNLTRDRAILALLFTLGLRVHELVALDVDQLDIASRTLVSVRGKGSTVHDLPVEASTLALVQAWIAERPNHANEGEPALFVSRRGTRLSKRSVQTLFQKLRLATGTKKKVTPHTARHSTATLALLGGADISSIGELLRHGDINTTRLYLRLTGERKRQVVQILSGVIPEELRVAVNDAGQATPPVPLAAAEQAVSEQSLAEPQGEDGLEAPAPLATPLPSTLPIGRSVPANDNAKKPFDAHGRMCEVQPEVSWPGYPQPPRARSEQVVLTWQQARPREGFVFHGSKQHCESGFSECPTSCIDAQSSRAEWSPCDG